MGDISAERISDLIAGIYDCALDCSLWPAVLDCVRQELGFHNASLVVLQLPSGAVIMNVAVGMPDPWKAPVPEHGADVLAMCGGPARILQHPLGEPVVLTQAADRASLGGSRCDRGWAQPKGIAEAVAIGFARDEGMLGSIGLGRHCGAGEVGERELTALRLIAPHFRRAVSISNLLGLEALRVQGFAAALDTVAAGIVLVGAGMQVLHANGVAAGMLRDEDVILTRQGALRLCGVVATRQLQAAVGTAAGHEAALGRRGVAVPVRARSGDATVVHVLPLRRGQTRSVLTPRAVAAIFVAPSPQWSRLPSDALAALYELTPAETRVMELVADGRTVAEIGRMIGVALTTVKTHLQRVFDKTGCRRQVEVANLARSLQLPR